MTRCWGGIDMNLDFGSGFFRAEPFRGHDGKIHYCPSLSPLQFSSQNSIVATHPHFIV